MSQSDSQSSRVVSRQRMKTRAARTGFDELNAALEISSGLPIAGKRPAEEAPNVTAKRCKVEDKVEAKDTVEAKAEDKVKVEDKVEDGVKPPPLVNINASLQQSPKYINNINLDDISVKPANSDGKNNGRFKIFYQKKIMEIIFPFCRAHSAYLGAYGDKSFAEKKKMQSLSENDFMTLREFSVGISDEPWEYHLLSRESLKLAHKEIKAAFIKFDEIGLAVKKRLLEYTQKENPKGLRAMEFALETWKSPLYVKDDLIRLFANRRVFDKKNPDFTIPSEQRELIDSSKRLKEIEKETQCLYNPLPICRAVDFKPYPSGSNCVQAGDAISITCKLEYAAKAERRHIKPRLVRISKYASVEVPREIPPTPSGSLDEDVMKDCEAEGLSVFDAM